MDECNDRVLKLLLHSSLDKKILLSFSGDSSLLRLQYCTEFHSLFSSPSLRPSVSSLSLLLALLGTELLTFSGFPRGRPLCMLSVVQERGKWVNDQILSDFALSFSFFVSFFPPFSHSLCCLVCPSSSLSCLPSLRELSGNRSLDNLDCIGGSSPFPRWDDDDFSQGCNTLGRSSCMSQVSPTHLTIRAGTRHKAFRAGNTYLALASENTFNQYSESTSVHFIMRRIFILVVRRQQPLWEHKHRCAVHETCITCISD